MTETVKSSPQGEGEKVIEPVAYLLEWDGWGKELSFEPRPPGKPPLVQVTPLYASTYAEDNERLRVKVEGLLQGMEDLQAKYSSMRSKNASLYSAEQRERNVTRDLDKARRELTTALSQVEAMRKALEEAEKDMLAIRDMNSHGASDRTFIDWLRNNAAEGARKIRTALSLLPQSPQEGMVTDAMIMAALKASNDHNRQRLSQGESVRELKDMADWELAAAKKWARTILEAALSSPSQEQEKGP